MARDKQAQRLAALRRRSKNEIRSLQRAYRNLGATEKAGRMGAGIQEQIGEIRRAAAGTYLGRKPQPPTRYQAEQNANMLETLIGESGKRGRAATRARQNRIFYQQMRVEARGGESAYFGGVAGQIGYEKIFYMATQDVWAGRSMTPEKRNEAIMEALGVDSLEDAYRIVLSESTDVIEKILERLEEGDLSGTYFEEIESDEVMAMLVGRGAQIVRGRQAELGRR